MDSSSWPTYHPMTVASEVHAGPADDEPAAHEAETGYSHASLEDEAKAIFVTKCEQFLKTLVKKTFLEGSTWPVQPGAPVQNSTDRSMCKTFLRFWAHILLSSSSKPAIHFPSQLF